MWLLMVNISTQFVNNNVSNPNGLNDTIDMQTNVIDR